MDEALKQAHRYLYSSEEEARIVKTKNTARDYLKRELNSLGEPDENGNIIWYFDDPLNLGEIYKGLMLQRRVSEYTDEDKAIELVNKYDLGDRCIKTRVVYDLDLDELYACNQEGIISDEEIDDIIVVNETWALIKVK